MHDWRGGNFGIVPNNSRLTVWNCSYGGLTSRYATEGLLKQSSVYPPPFPRPDPAAVTIVPPRPVPPRAPQHMRTPPSPVHPRGRGGRVVRAVLVSLMVAATAMALVSYGEARAPVPANAFPFATEIRETRVAATFACPVQQPYNFTSTFGEARSGSRKHKGADMFAVKGSPVVAVTGGTVTKAVPTDDGTLGGARVWVAGDDGWWYYYAHLDSVAVTLGQRVETAQQLGTVGNTGAAKTTPPHVHVEQHLGAMEGRYVDPFALMSVICPR